MNERAHPVLNRILGAGLVLGALVIGVAVFGETPAQTPPVYGAEPAPPPPPMPPLPGPLLQAPEGPAGAPPVGRLDPHIGATTTEEPGGYAVREPLPPPGGDFNRVDGAPGMMP